MIALFVELISLQTVFGKYVHIENQYLTEPEVGMGEIYLSISLRNDDGSADNSNGVKIAFEFTPYNSFKAATPGIWKYFTTNGCVQNIVIRQSCGDIFSVIVKAPGYTSATSNSFTKTSSGCWHSMSTVSVASACIYESFILLSMYYDVPNKIQPNYPLLLEELGDSPITGITFLSPSTGWDETIISFNSIGTKYIYSIYDNIDITSVPITILYCTASHENSITNEETIFKLFSPQITIKKNGQICSTCQGTINLYSSPSTILDGLTSSSIEGQVTNGIASFTNLSVQAIGLYYFYVHSQFLEADQIIATVNFNKAKLEVSVLTQPVILNSQFSVKVVIKTYNSLDIISSLPITITITMVSVIGNTVCTTTNGECIFSNLIYRTPEIYQIIATCSQCEENNSISVEVPLYTKIEIVNGYTILSADNKFEVNFSIYSDIQKSVLYISESYIVTLTFPSSILEGYNGSTSNGILVITDISISIPGTYTLYGCIDLFNECDSKILTIENYYIKAKITPQNSMASYPLFDIAFDTYRDMELSTKEADIIFTIEIYTDTSTTINGNTQCTTVSGNCKIEGVSIQSEGSHLLFAKGIRLMNWRNTYNFDVPANKYLKLTLNPPPATTEDKFTFEIGIYLNFDFLNPDNINSYEVIIDITPINTITEFAVNVDHGLFQYNDLSFTIEDIYNITIYALNAIYAEKSSITIKNEYIKVSFTNGNVPTYANNIFSILAHIYKGKSELSIRKWEVSLNLEPNAQLIGVSNAIIETGSYIFINLQIQAIGKFKLKASGANLLSGYTEDIDIKICYSKISIVGDHPYTTEKLFKIEVSFYVDIELISIALDFFDTIDLYLNPVGVLEGTTEKNCTYFEIFDNLKVLNESSFSILAKSNFSTVAKSELFEIKNYYLSFLFIDPIPVNTESIFSGIVSVFEDIEMNFLCLNCSFKIKLSIDNNGTLAGNKVKTAVDGIATFSGLRIMTENNYIILIKSDRAISSESNNFTIKNYYLHLKIISTYPDIHTRSYFSVEVKIYDGDNIKYESQSYKVELNFTLKYNINPKAKIENYNPIRTNKGYGIFSDLIVSEIGYYSINAYGEGLISGNTNFDIVDCYFSWSFKLVDINNILIQFDKNLTNSLSMNDFLIKSKKSIDFFFQPQNTPIYNFTTIAKETIPHDTEITIEIIKKNDIKSEDGLYFDYSVLHIYLNYVFVPFPSIAIVQTLTNLTSITTKVSTSSSVAVALVSNPSFLWSLMNCLDLISYLPLSSIPYTDNLVTYFTTLGSLNLFPNPAEYLFTVSNKSEPYLEAKRFGLTSSYFLYNGGFLFTFFLISILLIPIYYLGSRIFKNSLGERCRQYLKSYKYGFFLRFWVQEYLNIGILSIVQIRSKYPETIGGIANLSFACICAILFILTPLLLFICGFISYKRNLITSSEFKKKWGTLYEEFKNNMGFWSTQFYTLFTLRRVVFVLVQIFLNAEPYIQNSLNLFFCVLQLLFNIIYMPYTSKIVMISTMIEETGILIILIMSYFFIYKAKTSILIISEAIIIFIITVIISSNSIISFILLFQALKEHWTRIKEKRAMKFLQSTENRMKVQPKDLNVYSSESQPTLFRKRARIK